MALLRIKILQIGDVHYPDAAKAIARADNKDPTFNTETLAALSTPPLQAAIRALISVASEQELDAVVLMGDVTSRGEPLGLDAGLALLVQALDACRIPSERRMVVTGNHDLARLPALDAPDTRFDELGGVLSKHGFASIGPDAIAKTVLSHDAAHTSLIGLNTCVGCGTKRDYPAMVDNAIRKAASDAIEAKAADEKELKKVLDAVYDMDTPAIHDTALESLIREAKRLNVDDVMVLAGHHNALPHTVNRISPYTDLINGGQFRRDLLACPCTIIYMHGHVHEDPIEVITNPDFPDGRLVTVAAPLLTEGFNIVELAFNSTGVALGCAVTRYRQLSSAQQRASTVRISFWKDRLSRFGAFSELARAILDKLPRGQRTYFGDLLRRVQESAAGLTHEEVKTSLEELWWLGVVDIDQMDRAVERWTIRSAV